MTLHVVPDITPNMSFDTLYEYLLNYSYALLHAYSEPVSFTGGIGLFRPDGRFAKEFRVSSECRVTSRSSWSPSLVQAIDPDELPLIMYSRGFETTTDDQQYPHSSPSSLPALKATSLTLVWGDLKGSDIIMNRERGPSIVKIDNLKMFFNHGDISVGKNVIKADSVKCIWSHNGVLNRRNGPFEVIMLNPVVDHEEDGRLLINSTNQFEWNTESGRRMAKHEVIKAMRAVGDEDGINFMATDSIFSTKFDEMIFWSEIISA